MNYFDLEEDVLYIAPLAEQLSIYALSGELFTTWGGGESSHRSGDFIGRPHGMWVDSHSNLYLGEVILDKHRQAKKYVRQR